MKQVVIDASVIASWFLPDEAEENHEDMLNNIDKIKIHVPSIFEHEFMNILLNAERGKRLEKPTSIEILETISRYPIAIEPSTAVLMDHINVFEMARTHNLTAYDAAYLELAARLDTPLITNDKPLLEAAKKLKLKTTM
jgi:predicted nucleic acid-binding protein